jgi:hypothetical protein
MKINKILLKVLVSFGKTIHILKWKFWDVMNYPP